MTIGKKHSLIAISHYRTEGEIEMPNVGIIELQDAETGERMVVDTRSDTSTTVICKT